MNTCSSFSRILKSLDLCLKAQQSLPGQGVNGEGLWLNSLDYLHGCYTQCSISTVLYVVCYQSVTRNSNNISSYIYNRELITQATPINHSPANSNFESNGWIYFSNSCFWWCYQTYFSEYNLCYLQSRCPQIFISKLFVNIS